jgi:hypothetical protein
MLKEEQEFEDELHLRIIPKQRNTFNSISSYFVQHITSIFHPRLIKTHIF